MNEREFTEDEILVAARRIGCPAATIVNELPRRTWKAPTWTWNQIESAMHRKDYAPEWRTRLHAELAPATVMAAPVIEGEPPIANDEDEVSVGEIRVAMPKMFRHLSQAGADKLTDQLAKLIFDDRERRAKYVSGGVYQAVKSGAVFQRSPLGDGWWGMGTTSHFTDAEIEKLGELKLLT